MIPVLDPGWFLGLVVCASFLIATIGIPTALLCLLIFAMVGRVPFRRARPILPAAGAVLMIAVMPAGSGGPPAPDKYPQTWALMMATSFLLNALLILAPFPIIRSFIPVKSPYLVILVTVPVTFFLLTCFGFIGGEMKMPPDTAEYERVRMMSVLNLAATEAVIAAPVYGGIAVVETMIKKRAIQGE